jgi:hypothetical protein
VSYRAISLAVATYGSGRFAFIPGRLNAVCTNGEAVSSTFRRRLLGWLSGKIDGESIAAAVVDIADGVDSVDTGIFQADFVSIERIDAGKLSMSSILNEYDCLIVEGAGNNNISPLSKANILSYVNSGKGVLFLDFSTVATVSAVPPGYTIPVASRNFEIIGRTVWTDAGRTSDLYLPELSDVDIPLVNTVYDYNLSAQWSVLAYHDDTEEVPATEDGVGDIVYAQSVDFSFPGEYFIGRFSTVYEKGIIDVEK